MDGKALLLDKGLTSYTYTFRKVSDNSHSIEATFRASRFTLTGIAETGGCIIPATATIDEGGYQLFTFTADTGFEIDGIRIDNGTLDPALRGKTEYLPIGKHQGKSCRESDLSGKATYRDMGGFRTREPDREKGRMAIPCLLAIRSPMEAYLLSRLSPMRDMRATNLPLTGYGSTDMPIR